MSFKMLVEVDADSSPDTLGEALRSLFFDEKIVKSRNGDYKETGCYSTFDWQTDVEPLPQLGVRFFDEGEPFDINEEPVFRWTRGKKNGIECRWYWDGDGTLAFGLPDGRWLMNTDCKKDHDWDIVNDESELW